MTLDWDYINKRIEVLHKVVDPMKNLNNTFKTKELKMINIEEIKEIKKIKKLLDSEYLIYSNDSKVNGDMLLGYVHALTIINNLINNK